MHKNVIIQCSMHKKLPFTCPSLKQPITDPFGGSAPDRDAVENRLLNQHLSMISRRYLRNLYRKAIIETRLAESKS